MVDVRTRLILASTSPRRRELLRDAGYKFDVHNPSDAAECGICSRETPPELVARLAYQKAADVATEYGDGIIIGADTVAECCGRILGKPKNKDHARQMLELMRGRVHHVYTGVCLWRRPDDQSLVKVDSTKLKMDSISDADLEAYLATDGWRGKAGAFGYQDGLDWIHVLVGSESNVVGLPLELLDDMLREVTSEGRSDSDR